MEDYPLIVMIKTMIANTSLIFDITQQFAKYCLAQQTANPDWQILAVHPFLDLPTESAALVFQLSHLRTKLTISRCGGVLMVGFQS
jgi:hypothetical protein